MVSYVNHCYIFYVNKLSNIVYFFICGIILKVKKNGKEYKSHMKVFFCKLHKAPLLMRLFFLGTLIFYGGAYFFIFRSLLSLTGIEDFIRYLLLVIFGFYLLFYLLIGLLKIFKRKIVGFIVFTIFTILLGSGFLFASHYIDQFYGMIDKVTAKQTSTYTSVLLAMKETDFSSSSKIGMITDEKDRTGYVLPWEFMKQKNMGNEISYYSDYEKLLAALYSNEVDAIFISKDYPITARVYGEETYQNIENETKIVDEYSKEMKTEESELLVSTKSLTEPFTVLLLGVDSDNDTLDANAAFNGDTLIMVTFNPKTLTATMLSVPRDMYVPIISAYGRTIGYNKINSSAAYGTASSINTMQALTDIHIDYFVKVNFHGVIDLVNALGGVDVDVEAPDYKYYVSKWGEGVLCESDANRT